VTPLVFIHRMKFSPEDVQAVAATHGVGPEVAASHLRDAEKDQLYGNDVYLVIMRECPVNMNPLKLAGLMWLSIRRVDGQPVRSWPDLQEIKNQLLGPESEAFESFPAESRRVDAANQYHLFGGPFFPPLAGFPRPGLTKGE